MNLPVHIAWRYLFSKKSHNAINIISAISVFGIAFATLAMVCTLSVFNGFTGVVTKTFSSFDPDLKIVPVEGKVFSPDDTAFLQVKALPQIDFVSETLEENALLRFGNAQEPILLKGVSPEFRKIIDEDKILLDGEFGLRDGDFDYGVLGAGLAVKLGVRPKFLSPTELYMPKRNVRVNMANPAAAFTRSEVYIDGIFALNQPNYDDQMLIVSIDLVRELLQYDNQVTSLDIKLKPGESIDATQHQIQDIIGSSFKVENQFQQQGEAYRMVNIEKWVTFFILAIIMTIAVFNVTGSLSMLIIEKQADIHIFRNLGANKMLVSKIFLFEGWLITFAGAVSGIVLGLIICLVQQHFGLLKLGSSPGTFVIDAYPVAVQATDVLIVFATVCIVGLLAVIYPVNVMRKKL